MDRGERPDLALNYFQSAWPSRAMMQSHYPRRIVESIAAWDAARVVHVSRFIVDAGYLYPDEAWAAIDAAVQMTLPEYPSWEEFQLGFLAGQVFWQSNAGFDAQEISADFRRYTSSGKSLLSRRPDSPWLRSPWRSSRRLLSLARNCWRPGPAARPAFTAYFFAATILRVSI